MTIVDQRHSLFAPKGSARNWVLLVIMGTALFRIWGAATIDLVIGEAYYLSSARQLHLGYFDQPPIFIWIIWLTKTLTGSEAALVLRLPFIGMFAAATWMFYRIGARFHSERAGLFTAIIANIPILFTLSIGSWMQPEAPLTLLWLVTAWLLMDVFFGPKKRSDIASWALIGVALGLTFMSKYHAVFLLYGAGLFAIFNKDARKWILNPGPYLAVLIAALISLPVVIWNAQNDWASFAFQGGRALGDEFNVSRLLRMVWGQLIYMTPWIGLPALWVGARTLLKGSAGAYPDATPKGVAFFFVMLAHGPILFFTLVAAWSETQFHFHWQAPGYMMLFPILGATAAIVWEKRKQFIRAWLGISTALSTLIMVVLVTHTASGWATFLFPPDQQTNDPTNGALRWNALETYFEENEVFDDPNTIIAGYHWTECGQIDNVVRGRLPLACLTDDPRNIAFNIELLDHVGETAYVAAVMHSEQSVIDGLSPFFDSVELVDAVEVKRGDQLAMPPIKIFKATNLQADKSFNDIGASEVRVSTLPRTQIARISGTVSREPASTLEKVEFWLDDQLVGELALSDWQETFEIDLPRNWSVGSKNRRLSVTAQSGVEIRFGDLEIKMSE